MHSQFPSADSDHEAIRETIRHEVDNINAELLLLACDDEIGGKILELLGANSAVQAMFANASTNGLRTATIAALH